MKKMDYLSPSSINTYYKNPKEFYLKYLSDCSPPRIPQTRAMAVGSSFDAYVKSYLHEGLFGKNKDLKYDLQSLFEAQVESHNRDWAFEAGKYAFDCYKSVGALTDLMLELTKAVSTPRFEIEIKGVVEGYREGVTKDIGGVVLLGKPDVFFINSCGCPVILDFKVNGFCGNYRVSPLRGYIKLRSPRTKRQSQHKNCNPVMFKGTVINGGTYLEYLNKEWAIQLSVYAWLAGNTVGQEFIAAIDQIVCNGTVLNTEGYPEIEIAEHRLKVKPDYQYLIFSQIQYLWELINSNHFFREMTEQESIEYCKMLDRVGENYNTFETESDKWFNQTIR